MRTLVRPNRAALLGSSWRVLSEANCALLFETNCARLFETN
ncbi:hypothetical protein [Microbispora hainanensis]|nr:hypothetical protein [Microbispora hainanensis]